MKSTLKASTDDSAHRPRSQGSTATETDLSVSGPMVDPVNVDPDAILAGLDPEQREVATTLDRPVVVLAGAGSGKTRAITHRIAYAVATGRQQAQQILAVTFTTRAAGEMKGRLADFGLGRVQARTFHSAALRQVRYFWPRATGRELPRVAGSTIGLIAEAAGRSGLHPDSAVLRDLAAEVSWAKVSNVDASDYVDAATRRSRKVAGVPADQVGQVLAHYEAIKRHRGLMDYDDILLCNAALLADYPEVAAEVRGSYRHFVVDEFQDVSPLQRTLLDLWLGERDDLCVVGDPNQAIHGFAGGTSSFLLRLNRDLPRARTITLDRNYRSTPQVLQLANSVIAGAHRRGRAPTVLMPQRPDGVAVSVVEGADESAEITSTIAWLKARRAEGIDWSQMAVLYRINAQAPGLEAALTTASIPYLVRGSERFYDRPEIVRALKTLSRQAELTPEDPGLATVHAVLSTQGWSDQPPEGTGRVREQWESLKALVGVAVEMADVEPGVTLAQVVAVMTERAQLQQVPTATGVTLSTIHSAKGLEWHVVAVVGVYDGMIPFAAAGLGEELEEERRLLYVALTRARDQLQVSWSGRGAGGRSRRQPSRFLAAVVNARRDESAGAAPAGRSRRRTGHCRVCDGALGKGAELKLGRHLDCPSEYDDDLFAALKAWRLEVSQELGAPAYVVFTDATLLAITEAKPTSQAELMAIHGLGPRKWERWGSDVLAVLSEYSASS